VVPADLLVEIRRRCDRRGALLVLDETRTALGWTGYRFASEPSGVVPDMMILGESLGGGLFPIAATVFTQRVNAFLNRHPLIHLSTFGGSDVGCTVAREMLAVCERVLPWTLAGECGAVLGKGLGMAARANPDVVESIRGAGMVWSLNTPDQATAKSLCRQLRVNGVVAMPGNVQRNTVVLRPSLLATRDELAFLVKAVEKAVAGVGTDPEARA
jgi:acetylornithine/succinyldiaminopimelate/putrescine aminotransferase